MLHRLRHWHWTLLHRVWGLPEHDHTAPHASLSEVLRSHPPVPAHHRRDSHGASPRLHSPNLQTQVEREWHREPRILKGWQRRIRTLIERRTGTAGSAQRDPSQEL